MQLDDITTPPPIHHSLGEPSERVIIFQQGDMTITHEYLYQTATPTRFYQHRTNTFCFVIKGEIYFKQNNKETALKEHQGTWLGESILNTATLLTPKVELCFIQFNQSGNGNSINNTPTPLHKLSSGTVESISGPNRTKSWPLWQGKQGKISLELYPPYYVEPLYYLKEAIQYILPLNNNVFISDKKRKLQECHSLGQIFPKKVARSITNQNSSSTIVLSVSTYQPSSHGRVLILKKP